MNRCRICGWEGDAEKYTAREMMNNTKEEFAYFVCPDCNCLQIEAVPEDLGKYYGSDYYSYGEPDSSSHQVSEPVGTRVLDVGCGAGHWLCKLARAGYTCLRGCDPFIEKDLNYENGVVIYKRSIHEMDGEFDCIYLNDSFEHMTDPHEVMDSIKRLLAPSGVARIKLPVFPNVAFDMLGVHWYQLDAPRHVFLHSKESMNYLARQHGLKIAKKEYDSNSSQILRSFLYSKDIPFWEQDWDTILKYFSVDEVREIEHLSEEVNQKEYGDHAVFYLVHEEM